MTLRDSSMNLFSPGNQNWRPSYILIHYLWSTRFSGIKTSGQPKLKIVDREAQFLDRILLCGRGWGWKLCPLISAHGVLELQVIISRRARCPHFSLLWKPCIVAVGENDISGFKNKLHHAGWQPDTAGSRHSSIGGGVLCSLSHIAFRSITLEKHVKWSHSCISVKVQ